MTGGRVKVVLRQALATSLPVKRKDAIVSLSKKSSKAAWTGGGEKMVCSLLPPANASISVPGAREVEMRVNMASIFEIQ